MQALKAATLSWKQGERPQRGQLFALMEAIRAFTATALVVVNVKLRPPRC